MAETPTKGPRPSPLALPTPSSPFAPSPLTPTGSRPRLGPRRQSRFTEDMTERTPAASISERSMDYYWYGHSAEDVNTNTNNTNNFPVADSASSPVETAGRNRRTWLRFVNGALHAVPCLVMVAIMGYAMRVLGEDVGSYMSILGIILLCVLFTDVVLDVVTLFQAQKPWPSWGLALRFVCGIGYIVLFLVYVGLGGPFPDGYTYWGLPVESASLLLYILLCAEGLWNLLHIPVSRYHLGTSLLGLTTPSPGNSSLPPPPTLDDNDNNRTSFNNPRFSMAGTEHSSISLTWHRWVRTRSTHHHSRDDLENNGFGHMTRTTLTREPSVDLTLRERPSQEEEEEEDDHDGAGSSRASSRSGHDGVHAGGKVEEGGGLSEKGEEGRVEERVRAKDVGQ